MIDRPIDILAVAKSCSVFRHLSDQHLRELCGKARIEHYHERTLLTERDDRPEYMRYIVGGSVDAVLSTAEGSFSSLPIFAGKWASWLGVFGSAPLLYDMWSSANATFVAFPARDVHRLVSCNAPALLEVIDLVGEWTRFLTGWTLSFAAYAPEKRLVYLLLLATSSAVDLAREGRPTAVTQTHISQFGFGSRQRVSRLLRGLAERGLIEVRYGGVLIPSRARLEAFMAEDSPPDSK